MGINILICDDDNISLKINTTYIEEFSHKYKIQPEITAFHGISQKLTAYIKETSIDIAVLDTNYNKSPGLSLAKELIKKNPWISIIFISEHTEYAMEAFHLLALGFIQKPIRQLRLERLFAKAIFQLQGIRLLKNHGSLKITVNKSELTIKQSSILYIEKEQQKTKIVTLQSIYEIYETLNSIESRLSHSFLRINQSIIVNTEKISLIEHNNVYIKTGQNFKIGRSYAKKVKETFSNTNMIQ